MGRSKFPGKPPKTVTRKRIKVLAWPEATQSDSVTVAENIYYGLSLFNETFGDNEKEHPPFHGFSSKEAKLSASYIKTQQKDAKNAVKKLPVSVENLPSSSNIEKDLEKDAKNSSSDTENHKNDINENKNVKKSGKRETKSTIVDSAEEKAPSVKNEKKEKFSNFVKTPVLKSVNNILDRHHRTRQLRNSTAKRLLQKAKSNNNNGRATQVQSSDKSGSARKFVLPMRSAHSSRVIKPNKRFIEELEEKSASEHSENDSTKQAKKAKKSKEEEENLIWKSDEKDSKTKLKKANTLAFSGHNSQQTSKNYEKSVDSLPDAQTKSSQVKSQNASGKNKNTKIPQNSHLGSKDSSQITTDAKALATQSQKNYGISSRVLPDSNVPNSESSRIQTRSGALNNASNGLSPSAKVPEIPEESSKPVSTEESNSSENNVKSAKNDECSPDGSRDCKNDSDNFDTESSLSESGSDHGNNSEDEQSEWTGTKLNGGKVILRKARLKLDNKTLGGTEGPFSMANAQCATNGNTNSGLTGTVKCGVCGAVRFYRFVKQARKFGIYSCESCRKFISKMIKRQACAKSINSILPSLQCHKGDGLCLVPPVVRSQQWNLMRCVYKARCPACWLKMCLKCYNIPTALRSGLNAMLPPLMRDPLSISLSLGLEDNELQNQKLLGCNMGWPAEDSLEKNLFKSAMCWNNMELGQKSNYQGTIGGTLTRKTDKFDNPTLVLPSKKRKKENRIKVRKKIKNPTVLPTTFNKSQAPSRQRLELKGPRVKHVCRSASVALGQPIATFPSIDGKEEEVGKNITKALKEGEKVERKEEVMKEKEPQKANQEGLNCNINVIPQSQKRGKNQQINSVANLTVERSLPKPTATATVHTVSIDFWEQYDPAEVGAKGFALIGSELFHIPAICFLCGSAGREPLIHCQCCCEPYHTFCLEPSEWSACVQPNWCCPRCTVCQTCQLRSGPKLSCIRCRQSFHHSCLSKSGVSARLYSPDRPYVCQSCIKCKSCGSEGVTVHVGNLPLCSMCFKLRQRGNYCPLCQRCYNENDFDTKMMECNECSCWVHALCEGLSDERYQILSYLPDTIEFTCRQCSPNPNSVWRNAIETELKTGFIAVIKSLSKNRKTCAALKWSPRKECLCRPLVTIRKLDFEEKLDSCFMVSKNNSAEEAEDSTSEKSTSESSVNPSSKPDLSRFDFECDDQPIDIPRRGLRRLRQKISSKDCSGKSKSSSEANSKDGFEQENLSELKDCNCSEQQIIARPSPTLMSVKRKVNGNEYGSLSQFHCDIEYVINRIGTRDLLEAYHNILKEIFPWFDPLNPSFENESLSTLSKNSQKDSESPGMKLDSVMDVWKEEILKSPKAVAVKTGNFYSNVSIEDGRSCCLCKGLGDGQELKEGRLLYCGQNEWVHSNCALWSNEVFEEIDGSLQNVHSAISRGRLIRCSECGKKGASVGCCSKNCSNTFHYSCARHIGMIFNDDKTVFCSLHSSDCALKTIQNESDFCLKRPVYVELDRKKKKFAEPDKVKVMIGSLTVDCLGTISPEFSDGVEKIIPSGYKCSRLYWSTVNPLKIVRYYIRTYVQVYVPEVSADLENNITIDHTKERQIEEELKCQKVEFLAVKQTLDALIDTVCNKEVDENLAEQSNTDLLPPELKEAIFEDLPHDILDGISMQDIFPKMSYEDFLVMDLKNDAFSTDLLKDDILPPEEDMKSVENKVSKSEALESGSQNDTWLESKNSVQDLMDDIFDSKNQKLGGKELKRSKSEVLANNSLIGGGGQRHQQRSCSLTWSCKLDSAYGSTMKRRKVPRSCASMKPVENILEPNNDRGSMFHDLRIPETFMVTVGRTNTPNELKYCIEDTNNINCRLLPSKDENKDHKSLLWHTRQQPRIVQVDGPADPSSASECSSPEYNIEERIHPNCSSMPQLDGANDDSSQESSDLEGKDFLRLRLKRIFKFSEIESQKKFVKEGFPNEKSSSFKIPQLDGADDISSDDECANQQVNEEVNHPPETNPSVEVGDQPVHCKRCQCTYRTLNSYNRHLAKCDIMTTSDSDSETMDNKLASPDSTFSQSIGSMSPHFIAMSPSEGHTVLSEYPDMQVTSPLEASVPSPRPGIQIEPIAQALITPQIHTHATVETVHQTVLTSNDMIVQTQYTRTTTTLPNSTVLPQESGVQITEITSPRSVSDFSDSNATTTPLNSPGSSPNLPSSQGSATYLSTGVQTATSEEVLPPHVVKALKPRSPRAPKPRSKNIKAQVIRSPGQQNIGNIRCQGMQSNPQLIQLQQSQRQPPTVILQQVAPQGIMSAYVETMQQQSGQNLQYIAAIGGQHEPQFKPQFIATNQLVPGAYIQTGSDNLLTLQNGGISVLPGVQLAQQQPTVLGTIIQQQPSAIQCGVISSEQLVLSSTPTLEMFTDSTGSMFVSSQPMYYGLETIVSNTVMSSSQFMTGAVPQVLSSSYQTTTQVFQASKLMEPIVDVQAVSAIPNVSTVQTMQGVPGMAGSYVVVNQPTTIADAITTPQLSVPTNPEPNFTQVACNLSSSMNSQPIEPVRPIQTLETPPVIPELHQTPRMSSPPKPLQQNIPTIPRVAVRPNPAMQALPQENNPWRITEPILGQEEPISNSVRPYFDSKHVSENTSMIKSSISTKIPPLPNHCITQRNIVNKFNDVNSVHSTYSSSLSNTNSSNLSLSNTPVISNPSVQNKITMPTSNAPTSRPMNRVLPMQAVMPKLDSLKPVQKPDIGLEEPTKPVIKPIETEVDLPQKEILPIIEPENKSQLKVNNLEITVDSTGENFKLMETFEEKMMENLKEKEENLGVNMQENLEEVAKDILKEIVKENVIVKENLNESVKDNLKEKVKVHENLKQNQKVEPEPKAKAPSNTSLKIVIQKQLQDGSYKITQPLNSTNHNKKSPQIISTEVIPVQESQQAKSLQLLPIQTFTLKKNSLSEKTGSTNSANLTKLKSPPIAVKKPRLVSKPINAVKNNLPIPPQKKKLTGPSLMYEVKSQDGFTHIASSMSEVWETVFQAVQNARKAHNLPPLPHNPLSENLGLENNAAIYLVEQLPGVNRCTKYKPKFHDLSPPKPGEADGDLLAECEYGAARAEPFKERKVHDMFSWLASRHRQQPKLIAISETESRRAASTNLPMAMRFRILKETSKESVGVYHSHIHGRGLFCLRDIEAGEMVIEYAGEVIRASLTDKREKYYDSKHIGCYMFKIDDHLVVDATMKGNAARFINHSCEPNCYSRVVDILGKKHILIFALRRIVQGEELTYDYKFPFEDIKIPCTCGSRRCRKYLN